MKDMISVSQSQYIIGNHCQGAVSRYSPETEICPDISNSGGNDINFHLSSKKPKSKARGQ